MAARSTDWAERAFSSNTQRPWTRSRLWSSTSRKSRARRLPARRGWGTQGPTRKSPIHRSLGRSASYRPYATGWPTRLARCSPRLASCSRMVREAMRTPWRAAMMSAIWGALLRAQPLEPALAVCPQPAVEGVAAHPHPGPVGMAMGARGQDTDEVSSLPGPQPRVGGLGDHRVAEEGDGLGVDGHG